MTSLSAENPAFLEERSDRWVSLAILAVSAAAWVAVALLLATATA
ncbi:MAG: hypothetical protein ACYDDF_02110 [Thermoplasmatota archaeon]